MSVVMRSDLRSVVDGLLRSSSSQWRASMLRAKMSKFKRALTQAEKRPFPA